MQTLYYGGDIVTMKGKNDETEAVLVEDGKIKFTGTLQDAKKIGDADAVMYDLSGKTLMPSFIDSHGHITMVCQFSEFADLSECTNFGEIVTTLTKFKEDKGLTKKDVIVGFGYDHNFLAEETHPDKFVLDEVSAAIPIFIFHTSSHMGVANSALLELAGINENTPNPAGARYGRAEGSDEPDGYCEESAALGSVLMSIMPRFGGDFQSQLMQAQQIYLSNGITTVQDGAASDKDAERLLEMSHKGLLNIDVVSYVMANNNPEEFMKNHDECDGKYDGHFKVGGWKVVLDGSPQGKSAWLSKPYEGESEYLGYPTHDNEYVENVMKKAVDGGYQILAHCNGDAASEQFISCYKKAYDKTCNTDKKKLRPMMIHCQTVRDDQLDRMKDINMIPSIFVAHTYYWGDVHLKNLGEVRGSNISPAKSALDRGLVFNFHQDPPVVKPQMLHTVWCAVNRITRNGVSIGPQQKIDVYNALKAVTCNAAYAYFEEDTKGTIEAGKLADLVILDRNPLKVPPMEIKDINVCETIKEGKTLYVRQ